MHQTLSLRHLEPLLGSFARPPPPPPPTGECLGRGISKRKNLLDMDNTLRAESFHSHSHSLFL
jgi:hypothetical protein